jgi:hypothetical protein
MKLWYEEHPMPFLRVDAYEGRSKEQVTELLDAIHRAVLSAFGVPPRDRYQIYQEHSEANLIVQDTGLGIEQNDIVVSLVANSDADWSFGNGRAQFLTGEL